MTEVIDDVVFARAPIDAAGAQRPAAAPEDAAPPACLPLSDRQRAAGRRFRRALLVAGGDGAVAAVHASKSIR